MTTLDSALQPVLRVCEERRDPREVFREFLDHLGRTASCRMEKPVKAKSLDSGKS